MRTSPLHSLVFFALLAFSPVGTSAQIDLAGLPIHRAEAIDMDAVAADDVRRDADGELHLYARSLALSISSTSDGIWTVVDGERICQLAVVSPGAKAMELLLEQMTVPPGARMRVLAMDGTERYPFFAPALPQGIHEYSTPLVYGDSWILEYREPLDAPFQGSFNVPWLNHAYREVGDSELREGTCHVNVACVPESMGWEDEIDATVRISVITPQGSGWCSGTLMNNVRQDCTPYILTAWHCGRTSTTAQFNQYKFYFNFQYATCAGGAYSTSQVMTGAQLKAFSNDYAPQYQGVGGSDFMLLRTNAAEVPEAFDPYWAGWDARNIASVSDDGVCIHHPTGAPKRISSYTQTLTTGHPMGSSGLMSHYKLKWAPTQNGYGVTEVGSSGSGAFKLHPTEGPVLIGTLTGSSAGSNCTNNTGTNYFGKMSYHWTNNPNTTQQKLKHWLDPDGTNALVLAGSRSPCDAPSAVHDRQPLSINVHPNPTSDQLWLDGEVLGPLAWWILDTAGRQVSHGSLIADRRAIDVHDLGLGTYILSIHTHDGRVSHVPFIVVD